MRKIFILFLFLSSIAAYAQVTVTPALPTADEEITIVYDATQGTTGLVGVSPVLMHAGVVLSGPAGVDWQNVKGEWGNPSSIGQMTSLGNNKWQIKITPRSYFGVADGIRIYRIGMVFRNAGPCGGYAEASTPCKEGKTTSNGDFFVDIYESNALSVNFTQPTSFPLFKNQGEQVSITANASETANLTLKINNVTVASAAGSTTLSYTHTITESSGVSDVVISADDGNEVKTASFQYIVRSATVNAARP
ncbi:MAG TPA: hypothetical protein VIN08_05395, partial [Ohtaekwangia sp.]